MSKAGQVKKSIRSEVDRRGWLLTAVVAECAVVALICVAIGLVAGYVALTSKSTPIQQPASLVAAGLFLLVATHSMWSFERWGRNVAIAITFCLIWVMAEALDRHLGVGIALKMPAVLFGALALSLLTSTKGRLMFRKAEKVEEKSTAVSAEVAK